jgi:PAS domain S-box-containing protein
MNKSPPSDETSKTTSERQHPAPPIARLLQSRLRDSDAPSPLRPQLVRHAPDRLAELGHTDDDDGLEESTDSGSAGEEDVTASCKDERVNPKARNSKTKGRHAHGPPSQPTLVEFREAIDSTVRVPHARSRSSYGTPGLKVKRVSPIREEGDGDSTVSLDTAIMTSEPIRTTSTESTASVETIKGSAAPTFSANAPLRTPSYPFPYVPGSPQSWQQSFHQPFMALSPTVSKHRNLEGETPGKASFTVLSGSSTPAANSIFMPPGTILNAPDDPRFPTPNLYDLVLQLNTEPGLEQWWATVTNILHDHFSAERATLAQPLDPTDIENVPWGQKATFSMFGREDYVSPAAHEEPQGQILQRPDLNLREPSSEIVNNVRPQKLHPERLRPRLEARHSYAGHGREVREVLGSLNEPSARPHNTRPQGPQRTVTHAAGMSINQPPDDRIPPKRFPSAQSLRHGSLSDPDFSSIEGPSDTEPYAEIYSTLRPLDQESRPLIEPSGISHLLERGRMVTITRDYSADQDRPITSRSAPSSSSTGRSDRKLDSFRGLFGPEPSSHRYRGYHEYEQHPQSPWTQSPAPSPAIQADEDINPFFASEDQLLDDTFNPTMSPKDYAQYDQVEALGVDHASTVIHIPLIHPTLSQPMQALRMTPTSNAPVEGGHRTNVLDNERRAPIAILSVLTSAVPYPSNLAHALKLLGPHLATSFQIAQQFSSTHMRAVHIRHRRTTDGGHASFAPMVIEPASLEDIVHAELEEVPRSTSGSMTSPSDYSGRSRISPSGSFAGTPGWDPAAHGWTASRSLVNTPAFSGSEMVDNYFEAKKRTGHRSSSIVSNTLPSAVAKSSKAEQKVTGSNVASSTPGASDTGSTTPRGERTPRTSATGKEDQLPSYSRDRSAPPRGESVSLHRKDRPSLSQLPEFTHARRHSVLHSYGADFEATFGGLPASSPGEPRTPGHARKPSYSEDMPPPSERLLRTIIDSVPVQIFTAQPETGNLSWVNSKFLIYRGQDATQVLKDPWNAIHPDDHRQFLPAWHRSLRTNQQLQQKVRLKRFDGSYRWFYVRAAPLKDKKQKVVHWIGTMMDFHEQQIAEINSARQQETAASEAKYRALANSSPQIVFAVNKAKGVTFCNTQWLQYSGQTEAQALGVGFMEHVHPDDLVKCKLPAFDGDSSQPTNVPTTVPPEPKRAVSQSAASSSGSSETEKPHSSTDSSATSPMHPLPQRELSQMASNGILKFSRDPDGRPSYSTEVRLKSRDGNYRWHLVRVLLAEPLLQHEDEEETWYGTCTDINDHKDLERDMKNTMDAKSRFLSNMSHEIRTPLNGITGMVNFLIDSSLTAEQMEHVNIIRASTEGLRGLINDILDLSKAEAGMIQLNMDWAYVRAIIEEVNDLTSAMAIDKGLELNYIVEEDVPPQVKGDRFRIRQILLNVVGNAIKFTQSGEVFIRCSVQRGGRQLERHELYLKFDVIDTGRGFTDKEADSLFKRFSQIDGSSTRQHGGTGLGGLFPKFPIPSTSLTNPS